MDSLNPIPALLRATATALAALPLAPGQLAQVQAQHPETRWLEACVDQAALTGDERRVAQWCRLWLRAWAEAVGAQQSTTVILCGGRQYRLSPADRQQLDALHAQWHFSRVLSGGAPGADTGGESWARGAGVPVQRVSAEWARYGRSAGARRNHAMVAQCAEASGLVIAFPGGAGTRHCLALATRAGLQVIRVGWLSAESGKSLAAGQAL